MKTSNSFMSEIAVFTLDKKDSTYSLNICLPDMFYDKKNSVVVVVVIMVASLHQSQIKAKSCTRLGRSELC